MDNRSRIAEIDITRQARALACLRLTDYALVVLCGFWAIGLLSGLVSDLRSGSVGTLLFDLIASLILCFAAYTGWRHVGVIDPGVWRSYRVVFPLLVVFGLLVTWGSLAASGSMTNLLEQDRAHAVQQLNGLVQAVWIVAVSLLGWISLTRLRRMKMAAMGATVDQVLARLADKGGVKAVQATDIRRINKPRGLLIGGAGALVLLAWNLAPTPNNKILADSMLRISQQVNLLGFFLLVRARRYFQIDAEALLAVDRRPPILFLRSFEDDEKQNYARSDKALLDFSLETRLGNHFSRFGPFVAIGSPKETVPQLGAARVLLSDDEWQPRVLSWMREASVIIMYSGKTRWVNWELRQVLENECVTRLILMIPELKSWRRSKRRAEISGRVKQIREVFKSTPWEEELLQFEDFSGLRAMLFRADGSMVMVKSRSRRRDSYHLAALVAHQILLDSEPASAREIVPAAGPLRVVESPATVPITGLHPTSAPRWGALAVAPAVPAPQTRQITAPAPIPTAVQNRAWPYIAGTAMATVLVCAVAGYAYLRHEKEQQSAHAADAGVHAAPAHSAVDIPPASFSSESNPADVSTNPNSIVPADKILVPAKKTTARGKPESSGRQSTSGSAFSPRRDPAQQTTVRQTITPQALPPDPTVAMLQNAQAAMNAGRLVAPLNDCALYWAQQLKQYGNPQGASVEKYVLDTMGKQIDSARASKNYHSAIDDLNKLMQFYPGRSELVSLKLQIESEQQRAAAQAQLKKFVLQHRHLLFANDGSMVQAYCVGVLVVAPDGTARFDCTITFDPQGRCDHVVFPGGTIKEVKFLKNGLLHVATNHMGNFDFYGDSADLQGAYQGLGPLALR